MIHILSVVHMEPDLAAMSLMRLMRTSGLGLNCVNYRFYLLNNCWPMGSKENTAICFEALAQMTLARRFHVEQNIGGHGGQSLLIKEALRESREGDYVLVYDPDSFPTTPGWGAAMVDVLNADPTLIYVSLMPDVLVGIGKPWQVERLGDYRLATQRGPEMYNVTMFRPEIVRDGIPAATKFYGHVEVEMFRKARERGMRHAYLLDYREGQCPLPHPKAYVEWKRAHAGYTFPGNFDEWVNKPQPSAQNDQSPQAS